jgi:hypothetical protein
MDLKQHFCKLFGRCTLHLTSARVLHECHGRTGTISSASKILHSVAAPRFFRGAYSPNVPEIRFSEVCELSSQKNSPKMGHLAHARNLPIRY